MRTYTSEFLVLQYGVFMLYFKELTYISPGSISHYPVGTEYSCWLRQYLWSISLCSTSQYSWYRVLAEGPPQYSRRVEDQAVPLALDVVVLRLLCDVHAVKLQLPGQLLLPLEDHQGNLRRRPHPPGGYTQSRRSVDISGVVV